MILCFVGFYFLDSVPDIEEENEVEDIQHQDPEDKLDSPSSFYGSLSAADPSFKSFEEDALYPYLMPHLLSFTKSQYIRFPASK